METTASQGATAPAAGGSAPSVASFFTELGGTSPTPVMPTTEATTQEQMIPEESEPKVEAKPEAKDHKTEDAKEEILAALKGKAKEDPKADASKDVKKATDAKVERLFSVKQGEDSINLKPDGLLKVKVDGKEVDVKVQDLVDNYSGKTNWSKKYQDLAEDKKAMQDSINTLYDRLVKQGDALGAIEVLAEALGADPLTTRKQIKTTLVKQLQEFASLSPEEQRLRELQEELSWHKQQKESERALGEVKAKQAALKSQLDKVQETYGLSTEQLVATYEELRALDVAEADLEKNPDLIGQYHKAKQTRAGIEDILKEAEAEFETEPAKLDAIERLTKVMQLYPDMTLTELRDYALEAYGSKAAKNLSRKLKKTQPTSTMKTPERAREPLTFDDL